MLQPNTNQPSKMKPSHEYLAANGGDPYSR